MTSIGSWSCLRCPKLIVAEAFQEKSHLRDPRQIAAATGKSLEQVLQTFDGIFNDTCWRTEYYITRQDIFKYAEETRVSVYYYEGGRLSNAKLCSNSHELAIVFASVSGHFYFFKGAGGRARDDLQRTTVAKLQNTPAPQANPVLAKSARHLPKPVESFEPFPWHLDIADVPAGLYWLPSESRYRVEDCDPECSLPGLLNRMLQSRRYPLVTMHRYGKENKHQNPSYHTMQRNNNTQNRPYEITYHKIRISITAWAQSGSDRTPRTLLPLLLLHDA